MSSPAPLVSIGIPTFNRAALLARSIESALRQDHLKVEIIISDNASTDGTEELCRRYASTHPNISYVRQPTNVGPTRNFEEVLTRATGELFMWLGDDDWIDPDYISSAVRVLDANPAVALVSGFPRYYRQGHEEHVGKFMSLMHGVWWLRVIAYYWRVSDNGTFYGVMRRHMVAGRPMCNVMGHDWLLMASIAARGKVHMLTHTVVHRELGGSTTSYEQIARVMNLSRFAARFPTLSVAWSALRDLAVDDPSLADLSTVQRFAVGSLAALTILLKSALIVACVRPWRRFRCAWNELR